jgi:CRISPR-associated protein Cas1
MFTKFEFRSRDYSGTCRPFGAVDPINALFNYGYSLLESQCHRAINAAGMDTHVGFVHEIIAGKTPLVYDLQEPFRCLIDMAIVSGLEKNVFKKSDFIRTENYNIRLRPSSAKKLVKEVGMVFNDRVNYRGGERTWTHVIMMKANELGLYLQGKRKSIDFSEPAFIPERTDDHELRQKILSLSQSEANKLGIGKSSLHYLRKHAKSDRPFKVYKSVKKRLVSVEK